MRYVLVILQEGIWTQDDLTFVLKPIFGDESTETLANHPHVLIKFKVVKNAILIVRFDYGFNRCRLDLVTNDYQIFGFF